MSPCRWCLMTSTLCGESLPELPGPPGRVHLPRTVDSVEAARQAERRARRAQEPAKRSRQGPGITRPEKTRLSAVVAERNQT